MTANLLVAFAAWALEVCLLRGVRRSFRYKFWLLAAYAAGAFLLPGPAYVPLVVVIAAADYAFDRSRLENCPR